MSDKDYDQLFSFFMFICFIFFILIAMIIIIAYTIGGNFEWFKDLLSNIF